MNDRSARRLLDIGLDVAVRLREEGPDDIYRDRIARLNRGELVGLVFVLAAAVDIDRPVTELTAWTRDLHGDSIAPVRQLRPHGTPAAYARHRRAGETPCIPCKNANAEDKRERNERRRKAA